MKKSICLAASLLTLTFTSTFGQPTTPSAPAPAAPPAGSYPQRLQTLIRPANPSPDQPPALTKFNLDFPGGTPKELVAAIEKAMGKPLNVIIPDEDAATKLPALKLNEVTFPQLSDTLRIGSIKTEYMFWREPSGFQSNRGVEVGYYFRTTEERPTDNSVWFFRVTKKPEQLPEPPAEKVSRFYSLSAYLDRGFTVDDITTAIQTGWKMAGETSPPELNYHKETGLLIAFGEPSKLKTINDVLQTLPQLQSQYWMKMDNGLVELQRQVKELQAKVAAPSTNTSPAEKSGK